MTDKPSIRVIETENLIPTPEELEAAGKPECDVAFCEDEAMWLVRNLGTGKEIKMCENHALWYSLPPKLMMKEGRL